MERVSPMTSPHLSDDEESITSITKDITKDTDSDGMGEALGKVTTDMMQLI
jgi:hypothetical protein